MRSNPQKLEDCTDFRGQSKGGTREQLIDKCLDGIEPVQGFRVRAVGYSFVVVAFAEVPEADLVEIVQAEGAREGVGEDNVLGVGGDDVC